MAKRKSASKKPAPKTTGNSKRTKVVATQVFEEVTDSVEEMMSGIGEDEFEEEENEEGVGVSCHRKITRKPLINNQDPDGKFLGESIPTEQARLRWPNRYPDKKADENKRKSLKPGSQEDDELILAKFHYTKAEVDGNIFELNDDAHVKSGDLTGPYICKIIELFEGMDGLPYFTAVWYYRSTDTVIKDSLCLRESKRIFPSQVKDDNPLDCLLEKVKIAIVKPNLDLLAKQSVIPDCDYYYDMTYHLPYSSFMLPLQDGEGAVGGTDSGCDAVRPAKESPRLEMTLLDLYSGCGAMSTGLCLGANLHGTKLVTNWAVDLDKHACDSLALNHPETNVRNESVENFLMLLKEWKKLCASYALITTEDTHEVIDAMSAEDENAEDDESMLDDDVDDTETFEIEHVTGICFGDPQKNGDTGLYFKVSWKGYGPSDDTWEPLDGLGNCRESIGEFVKQGYESKILPLPGDVDVICGGPPCQGISGFNRYRNKEKPLEDIKNRQLEVYMDVVDYLKPRFVLMENVVDLVKFSDGFLGRFALGRLVDMNYQARMGLMAAGAYGLPQFRMRVFIWGAQPSEKLPMYPLPTHDLVMRGFFPKEFMNHAVAYDEGHTKQLENKLFLEDAISDLPPVTNFECNDVLSSYGCLPKNEFQWFIRKTKDAMSASGSELLTTLYDHRPLKLNDDDYLRVCHVPKAKGANFRDLEGVQVDPDTNKVEWKPNVPRVLLPSGKPLVPDYAMTFVRGTSSKPFGRLWWDETVATVVTRAEPHNQVVTHPEQDRVLTIRENARLQGFPDYYQLKGPVKQRYMQVGNAVAVPVARALGYALAKASQGICDGDEPVFELPEKFPAIRV